MAKSSARRRRNGSSIQCPKPSRSLRRMTVEPLEDRRLLAVFTVTNLNDTGGGSLRGAIETANVNGEPDVINFQAGLTGTIELYSGYLAINDDLTISGPGAGDLAVDANETDTVFYIFDGDDTNHLDVTLDGLTITGGVSPFLGVGGVGSTENLTLSNSVVSGNTGFFGGGVAVVAHAGSTTTISNCMIFGNYSVFGGGGVLATLLGGNISINNSSITGNEAAFFGGGVFARGADGNLRINNVTISANTAADGGGVYIDDTQVTIAHSTVTGNTASSESGGGVLLETYANLTLDHSIVAANPNYVTGSDIDQRGTLTSSFSLIGDNSGIFLGEANPDANGNIVGGPIGGVIDPLLSPLALNGGATLNHSLQTGSLALDTGDPNITGQPEFDQRGAPYERVFGARIDMGSYEARPITIVVDNLSDESDGDFSAGDLSLREAVELSNSHAGSDTIAFAPSFAGQTILLTMGELVVSDSTHIVGPAGPRTIIRSFNSSSRIFSINDGDNGSQSDVTISGLELRNALTPTFSSGGAIRAHENLTINNSVISGNTSPSAGGAISQYAGSLTIEDSLLENNAANYYSGGAIAFTGTNLVVRNSTIANNTANATASNSVGGGGGIFFRSTGTLLVENSLISGNTNQADGGGIYARDANSVYITGSSIEDNVTTIYNGDGAGVFVRDSVTKIIDSSISGNSATDDGGGLYVFSGSATVTNSTISGNSAGDDGGGVRAVSAGSILFEHTTLADNVADADNSGAGDGGGIELVASSTITLANTIVGDNRRGSAAPNDIFGTVNADFSLIETTAGATINGANNITGVDPILGPLVITGGLTRFHGVLAGSPAVNAGDPTFVGPPDFDQRGAPFVRVAGGRIDVGAIESQPLTLVVDTLVDESDGNTTAGDLSLREAIELAASPNADTISFDPGLSGQTITLTMGQLDVRGPVTVNGLGAAELTIDGGNSSRIFNIDDGIAGNHINVAIDGVTLTRGFAVGYGGAIQSVENLTLTDSVVTNNTATRSGGGIYARNEDFYGTTYIIDTMIVGNRTTTNIGPGGGLYIRSAGFASISGSTISGNSTSGFSADGAGLNIRADGGTVVVSESTITGNTAEGSDGGGLYFNASDFGAVVVQGSTVSGNQANGTYAVGGGMFVVTSNYGLGIVFSSTVSGNSANSHGGGISLAYGAEAAFSHTTITDNTSDADNSGPGQGGGLFIGSNSSVTLKHTIVAANTDRSGTAADIRLNPGTFSPSFSLIGDNTGSGLAAANPDGNGNIIGGPVGGVIDPGLGLLADNGGPTLTHELLVGSPGLDAGDLSIINPPSFDQRAAPFARISNGRIDIGAFEVQVIDVTAMVVDTALDESDGDFTAGDLSLREAIELANAATGHSTISFDPSLTGSTITLTMGQLEITDSVDVLGLGSDVLTVDASGNDPTPTTDQGDGTRVFLVDDGDNAHAIDVTIQDLTVTGGDELGYGGGIYAYENLTLSNALITGNAASGRGGLSLQIPSGGVGIVSGVVVSDNQAIPNGVTYIDGAIGGALLVARDGAALTVDNLIVENNTAENFDGGLEIFSQGGTVVVEDTTISGNTSLQDRGGGSFFSSNYGQLTITRTNIYGNSAAGYAGGVELVTLQGNLTLSDSSVTDNSAAENGGGLYVVANEAGSLTISGSTIANNSATNGGGVAFYTLEEGAVPLVENTTISGNFASGRGGGVSGYADGSQTTIATLRHTTVTENTAVNSGGGLNNTNESATFDLDHVIAAGNVDQSGMAPDITTGFVVGHSLIGDNSGSGLNEAAVGSPDVNGNLVGGAVGGVIDALLGPLADNGGATQTHALLVGSPAVNEGDPTAVGGVGNVPTFDQRGSGFDRVLQGRIDIGAFESDLLPPIVDGDFNDDGLHDCLDIDALVAEIAAGTDNTSFDLSGDGLVDVVDRDLWLAEAGAVNLGPGKSYLLGDANLDGFVDGLDFIQWNANKFTSVAEWCAGDFNADGFVDGLDFIIWNANKFQSSDAPAQTLFRQPHELADTDTVELEDQSPVRSVEDSQPISPAPTRRIDAVFAGFHQRDERVDGKRKADVFDALLEASPINSWVL